MGRRDRMVHLRRREFLIGPGATGRQADRAAAVIGDHEMGRIGRADPQIVEVAVGAVVDDFVRHAAIGRAKERGVLHVDHVTIVVIGKDVGVVERTLADGAVVIDQLPRGTGIVAAEQAAVGVLHESVDAVGIGARDCDADAADDALLRQPRRSSDLGPGLTAVGALEEAAAGST